MPEGKIKKVLKEKGFGFIESGRDDLLFHHSELKGSTIEELSDRATQVSEIVREYPTGSWGDESRDYHVAVKVPPKAVFATSSGM